MARALDTQRSRMRSSPYMRHRSSHASIPQTIRPSDLSKRTPGNPVSEHFEAHIQAPEPVSKQTAATNEWSILKSVDMQDVLVDLCPPLTDEEFDLLIDEEYSDYPAPTVDLSHQNVSPTVSDKEPSPTPSKAIILPFRLNIAQTAALHIWTNLINAMNAKGCTMTFSQLSDDLARGIYSEFEPKLPDFVLPKTRVTLGSICLHGSTSGHICTLRHCQPVCGHVFDSRDVRGERMFNIQGVRVGLPGHERDFDVTLDKPNLCIKDWAKDYISVVRPFVDDVVIRHNVAVGRWAAAGLYFGLQKRPDALLPRDGYPDFFLDSQQVLGDAVQDLSLVVVV